MISKEENEGALRKAILEQEDAFINAGIVTRDVHGELRDLYDILDESFESNKKSIAEKVEISPEFLMFFSINKHIIGDFMQERYAKTCFNIKYCIGDQVFSTSSIPYSAMRDPNMYAIVWQAQQEQHRYHILDSFFNPLLRSCIMEGRDGYQDWVHTYFDSINEKTGKIMLATIRDQFPDFYQFITEKYEIPRVEEIDEWLKNKKEIRQLLDEVGE